MTVYTVLMRRNGEEEGHHYILGIYSCLGAAYVDGKSHEQIRAGKYEAFFFAGEVDGRIILIDNYTAGQFAKLKYPEMLDQNLEVIDK